MWNNHWNLAVKSKPTNVFPELFYIGPTFCISPTHQIDLTEENNYFTSRAKISIITNVPVCVTWIMDCRMKWHDVSA